MFSLFKKTITTEQAALSLAGFVKGCMEDQSPPNAIIAGVLSSTPIRWKGHSPVEIYTRELMLLNVFCGDLAIQMALSQELQAPLAEAYSRCVDSLLGDTGYGKMLKISLKHRIRSYSQVVASCEKYPDPSTMVIGNAFSKEVTDTYWSTDWKAMAILVETEFKCGLLDRVNYLRSVRIRLPDPQVVRRHLLDLIQHNATTIQQSEGKTKAESEYLAICAVLDDVAKRINGQVGHQIIMDMLMNEHAVHFNDVLRYLAVTRGNVKLKPEAEEEFTRRHN